MSADQFSPVIRSLHQVSQGAYDEALDELHAAAQRAMQGGQRHWAAVVLWQCMVIAEGVSDWTRAIDYGEKVLLLQDDAYVRLFLFRAYREAGNEAKASEHLRASVDLADETRDQSFLETLVRSASFDQGHRARRGQAEGSGRVRWTSSSAKPGRARAAKSGGKSGRYRRDV